MKSKLTDSLLGQASTKLLLLACFFLSLTLMAQGDGTPIEIGKSYTIQSEILGQERPLMVYLPDGYAESDKRYPVMYLLDGGGNFHHTTASVKFLARNGRIPQMIVVGIPNTDDRTRDLTPPTEADKANFPTAGGAENMLSFIEQEAMSFVKDNFRVNNYKMLVGHSFGGLFAIHTLLHHPEIFNSYIAISPSLWWDDQSLVLEQTDDFFANNQGLDGHLYMTMGGEDGTMLGGAWKLAALLEEKGGYFFQWEFDRMAEETHGSIPMRSTYKGLEYIFADYNLDKHRTAFETGSLTVADYEKSIQDQFDVVPDWEEGQLLYLGRHLFNNAKPAMATPVFQRCTELFPKSEEAWLQYGESLAHTGQNEAAIACFEKARALNPDNMQTLISLKRLGVDVGEETPEIQLSASQLAAFNGSFKLDAGFTVRFESDGEQIWVHAPETAKEALYPIGEDAFYLTSKSAKLFFEREAGEVVGLRVETPGPTFKGTKID